VIDVDTGAPVAGAELDVWQNGENRLYAVQDPHAPEDHLRGRFRTRDDGYATLVTHIFDQDSEYLESDAVFAVKSSLLRHFEERSGKDPARPPGVEEPWCSLLSDLLLARGASTRVEDHGRTA
jgi:hypothetical protein